MDEKDKIIEEQAKRIAELTEENQILKDLVAALSVKITELEAKMKKTSKT